MFLEQVITTESVPFYSATANGHKLRHWKLYKKEIAETERGGKSYATAEEMHADILK